MKLLILIFSLLVVGCANDRDIASNSGYIDPQLKPYYEAFLNEAEARGHYLRGIKVEIIFDSSITNAGECKLPERVIKINPEYFNFYLTEWGWNWYREYLLFHELGHCLLNKSHIQEDGYMKPALNIDDNEYNYYKEEWLDLLFL